jgi:threonine synthase
LLTHLQCARCGLTHDAEQLHNRCECGGTLLARYEAGREVPFRGLGSRPPGMWRYKELLPLRGDPLSLGHSQTPLLFAPRLADRWGVEVFIKDDSPLPGATFKARGAAVGMSRALELGADSFVMPSAGNAGGAWALYAARAGVPITVTMARSAPEANQREVLTAGGELVLVDGTIGDAAAEAYARAESTGAFFCATFSEPYRIEGKKTAWLEVFDQLGDGDSMGLPRTIIAPVGGGVALWSAAKASAEVAALGWTADPSPQLIGVQASGCAPIVRAFESGSLDVEPWVEELSTAAAGLRVPAPSEGTEVLDQVRASGGLMLAVTEEEIAASTLELARGEGVWACPEGATTAAAATRLAAAGALEGPVVLYNTGSGAKYP